MLRLSLNSGPTTVEGRHARHGALQRYGPLRVTVSAGQNFRDAQS